MRIRQGRPDDLEASQELAVYAFSIRRTPDWEETDAKRYDKTYNQYWYLEDDSQKPVAMTRLIPYEQNIRGVWKKMTGISAVASAPEVRRKGHMHKLLITALKNTSEDGYALSTLYAFKDFFYVDLGYVKQPPVLNLELNPRQLYDRKMPAGYTVQHFKQNERMNEWKKVYNEAVKDINGAVKRDEFRWTDYEYESSGNIAIVYSNEGIPEGVMLYQNKGYGEFGHIEKIGEMRIADFYWTTPQARRALLHFIFLHSDQIVKVYIPIAPTNNQYVHWYRDMNIPILRAHNTPLARIVDIKQALEGVSIPTVGEVRLRVKDDYIEENNQTFRIYEEDGKLSVEATRDQSVDTTITIHGLTSLLYGSLSTEQVEGLGHITGETPPEFKSWFKMDIPWLTDSF